MGGDGALYTKCSDLAIQGPMGLSRVRQPPQDPDCACLSSFVFWSREWKRPRSGWNLRTEATEKVVLAVANGHSPLE